MPDPRNFRISDADNPDRLEEFESSLKRSGQSAPDVIRQLAESYIRYVAQHGHGPPFPVQIVPFEPPQALSRKKS
jgi:hypothetical protein